MSSAVVITTLNEIDGARTILPKIRREWADEWVIVDGNSTDGTIQEAQRLGFRVVLQQNKGHGDAVITGVNQTKSDYILLWGPDGNHELEEIPRLIEKINEGHDQIIVSRFGKTSINEDAGPVDRFGNRMFTFLINVFFGGQLTDALNLSRIVTRKSMLELKLDAPGLESTTQMSVRALKKRQKITEIIGNERPRLGGKRKMRPLPVGADLSLLIMREFIFWNVLK